MRHLEVDQAGGAAAFTVFGVGFGDVVDDVIARAGASTAIACFFRDDTVTNTICASTGSGGTAIQTQANLAAATMIFRNVTAVSSGAFSTGILLQAFSGHALNALLVNTIAQGVSTGLSVMTDSSASVSSVAHISYSDIPTRTTSGTGVTIDDQGHNLTAAATFANLAGGDLHELASSVTVNNGVDDAANGTVDLDGNPRSLGPATDIGAYEFPEAPTATTSAATSVHTTDAQLSAQVNPQGLPTTVSFQYGTSSAYGASTTAQSVGSGRSSQAISAALSGLAPMTTVHYRVVAVNAAGSTFGADMTFTTSAPPAALPIVSTGPAAAVTDTSARVAGTVTPNGTNAQYHFEYGQSTSYGTSTPALSASAGSAPVRASASLSKLKPATTYHYRLVATSAVGTSNGTDRTFRTLQSRCVVPKLVGKTLSAARRSLLRAHCRLGRVARPTRKRHRTRGSTLLVISQSLKPGARRPTATRVNVTLGPRHAKRR